MSTALISLFVALATLLSGFFPHVTPIDVSLSQDRPAQVIGVIDGDTIEVMQNSEKFKVRYIGIDTPEPYRDGKPACYSHEATEANRNMVEGKQVRLVSDSEDTDKYGRLLRYVYVGDTFVNASLVQEGFAKTLSIQPNTTYKNELGEYQAQAQEEEKGMWGACK
jgi:endonuclease YncB( thermonuclease family)